MFTANRLVQQNGMDLNKMERNRKDWNEIEWNKIEWKRNKQQSVDCNLRKIDLSVCADRNV